MLGRVGLIRRAARASRRIAAAGLLLSLLAAAGPALVPALGQAAPQLPSLELGDLYRRVELGNLFPDQKTFADAIPKRPPAAIMADYAREKNRPGFDLRAFVARNFAAPVRHTPDFRRRPDETVSDYIQTMWTVLRRRPDEAEPYSSLLPLPRPYVVPGGRFSEIYYWDSYFTMLGLAQDGRHDIVGDMLANIASLIGRYGHMPNGNRSYYLSRSQPPFFADMIELAAAQDGAQVYRTYLPALQAEYDYWMEGADALAPGSAHRHVVRLADGTLFNRYWDDRAAPRDESYRQDVETARATNRAPAEVYRDLRAGAETGWDYSSRWLADGQRLATIRTTAIVPVDLNAAMVKVEQVLAHAYDLTGKPDRAKLYAERAKARAAAIRRVLWDAQAGLFTDYRWREGKRSAEWSAATVYPLFFGVANADQAHRVAATLRQRFLRPGGLATSLKRTGQQWDAPNGWAPLQYMAVEGLKAYGEDVLARDIAIRWIALNVQSYRRTGVLLEKYDVEQPHAPAGGGKSGAGGGGGGEYKLQIGFGWTNGVLAKLMAEYPDAVPARAAGKPVVH